jgi:hypothetical protein
MWSHYKCRRRRGTPLEEDLFLYHVAENLVEPKDRGTARGEPLVEYDKEDGKISFLGPKKLFEEFRAD